MNNKERIKLCNSALETCKGSLSAEAYSEIHDNINKYNEWGLGIETLIDILYEDDVSLNEEQFTKIQVSMESMGLGQSDRVGLIRELVRNT